jgi:hypothetical protein
MKLSLSQTRTKANTCLFCREKLKTPTKCQYCGFKFCADHISTDDHQCGKTRYAEYVRKVNSNAIPNLASGIFSVICDTCGYRSTKGSLIEFAGEELIKHMQVVGCSENTFLEEEEITSPQFKPKVEVQSSEQKLENRVKTTNKNNSEQKGNIVEQLANLASLREKGVLSDDEFIFIKKEIIKNLQ